MKTANSGYQIGFIKEIPLPAFSMVIFMALFRFLVRNACAVSQNPETDCSDAN
jgi:hypothetical protein